MRYLEILICGVWLVSYNKILRRIKNLKANTDCSSCNIGTESKLQEKDLISQLSPQKERITRSLKSMDESQIDQELEAAIALLRLDALDRLYSRHSRPRFGKRNNDMHNMIENKQNDDGEDEWQAGSQLGQR